MDRFDALFQRGSTFMVGLGITLIGFFVIYSILVPDRKYIALVLVIVGLVLRSQSLFQMTCLHQYILSFSEQ